MVGPNCLLRIQYPVNNQPQEPHKRQLVLGIVDLATKQSHPRSVLLGLVDQLERIQGRAGRATQDADHQARIVVDQLLGRLRTVVDHLQEQRSCRTGDTGQGASDQVVDETRQQVRRHAIGQVGIEHLQEMPESLALGLVTEDPVGLDRLEIVVPVVGKGDRVETKIRSTAPLTSLAIQVTTLDVVDRSTAERLRGRLVNPTAPHDMDVSRIVGPYRRGYLGAVKNPLADRQLLVRRRRHQHDVDQSLRDNLPHHLAVLTQRSEHQFAVVTLRRPTRCAHPKRHVGVLGIGQNELAAARRIRGNRGQLAVKRLERQIGHLLGLSGPANNLARPVRTTATGPPAPGR